MGLIDYALWLASLDMFVRERAMEGNQQNYYAKYWIALILLCGTLPFSQPFDYKDALSKSILYFESQRSGHLPFNQRVTWRYHSALADGSRQGVCSHLPYMKHTNTRTI